METHVESRKRMSSKQMVTMAMLAAMAYIVMLIIHIRFFNFLTYDAKDVIITIGGFLYGPFAAALISVVVAFAEMVTVSTTGIIGFVMNVLASAAFACTASLVYRRMQSLKGAIIGLVGGVLMMTAIMILWNYLITPLYMAVPREQVVGMLVPVFLPFNLVKGGLNAAVTMLLYKPIVLLLRKVNLVPEKPGSGGSIKLGVMVAAGVALVTFILLALVLNGTI